jgi:hypothetical protein
MGPRLKHFEVLEIVISFETFSRTRGRLIYTGLTTEVHFVSGSFDFPTAAHNAVFAFLFFRVVEEVWHCI